MKRSESEGDAPGARREREEGGPEVGRRWPGGAPGAETTRRTAGRGGAERRRKEGGPGVKKRPAGGAPGVQAWRRRSAQGAEKRRRKRRTESLRGADMTPPQAPRPRLLPNSRAGRRGAGRRNARSRREKAGMTPRLLHLPHLLLLLLRRRGEGRSGRTAGELRGALHPTCTRKTGVLLPPPLQWLLMVVREKGGWRRRGGGTRRGRWLWRRLGSETGRRGAAGGGRSSRG